MSVDIKDVKVGGVYYLPIKVKSAVSEDINDICITDENGDQWNEYDAAEMVTSADIVKAINEKMDDQVDFWKRDSESAHEEIRRLQEQVKRLEDSNGQYAEQIQKYDNTLTNTQDKVVAQIKQLAKTEKRCDDLQKQLERLNGIKDKADLANKACTERDAAQRDLVTAREAIDYLQEENKKLKQELKDAEGAYNVVDDTSIKRNNRVKTMEAVIDALVEKIRRLEGGEQ